MGDILSPPVLKLKAMVPEVRNLFKDQFKRNGRYLNELSPSTIELIFVHNLFKCFLPKELGGLDLTMLETLKIIEDAAYLNGSFGWLIQIGNGGNYFASCFTEQKTKSLFTPKDAVIAGSGAPSGTGSRTAGGYVLNGNWKYCSGSDYASLFTVTFCDSETNEQFAAILPRDAVKITKDWNAIGLMNTSTHSIHLNSVFVPEDSVFKVNVKLCMQNHSVFNLPFIIFAQAFFIHVMIGVFDHFLDESINLLQVKSAHWKSLFPKRYAQLTWELEEGKQLVQTSRQRAENCVYDMQSFGSPVDKEDKYNKEMRYYAARIRQQAHMIYGLLGIEVLDRDHVISVCYLDLLTTSQHYLFVET